MTVIPRALTRRAVLAGSCAAGCAALAACATYTSSGQVAPPGQATGGAAEPTAGGAAGGASGALAKTSDIEVGGGTIFEAQQVVVTQPTAGQFEAFSTTCTHQGCAVTTVAGGEIGCPCHGSKFSITDGSPLAGPAPRPLAARAITVTGEDITLA